MEIDHSIRRGVIESLPEINEIQDESLREKVCDAWTLALQESGFNKLEEIEHSAEPGKLVAKSSTQAHHLRAVARLLSPMVTNDLGFFLDIGHSLLRERGTDNVTSKILHGLFFPRLNPGSTKDIESRMAPLHQHVNQVFRNLLLREQHLKDLVPDRNGPIALDNRDETRRSVGNPLRSGPREE